MKRSFIFTLFLLSIFLYQAQGIRIEKSIISASNHQELISKTSLSIQDDGPAMATEFSPGINRKLMTKIQSSNSHSTNSKNVPNLDAKFTHGRVGEEETFPTWVDSEHGKTKVVFERYPDVIDMTGMDYSPAKRKPPIHN